MGAGYVSVYHIRAVQSTGYAVVIAIADANRERAREVAARFGIPQVYGSLAEMAPDQLDVIHILTPPAAHCDLTLQALDMGCHVMVEKPMAENTTDCDRMISRAKEKGRLLTVNHSARMDPIVLRGLDLIAKGAIGDVIGADFFRSSDYPAWGGGPVPPPFRNGSYPFQDLGVHALYLLEAFLGELRDVDVKFRSSGRDPNLYFDEWRAAVNADRGSGNLYLSWNVRPMQNELVVHGTRGVMHIDCFLQTCTVRPTYPLPKAVQRMLAAGLNSLSMLFQVTANGFRFVTGKLRPSPGIHESVVRFYDALKEGKAPPVPAEEGRRIVAWMEAVSRDADEQKRRAFSEAPAVVPPRVLVTGSSGFLGSALLRRLRDSGEAVRVLRRRPGSCESDPKLHVVYGDLGDPAAVDRAVAGVDVVYHVGAAMKGWAEDFQRGTVLGTQNVIDACLRHHVKRLVYVSSLSVLDHAGHPAGHSRKGIRAGRALSRSPRRLYADQIGRRKPGGGRGPQPRPPGGDSSPGPDLRQGRREGVPFGCVWLGRTLDREWQRPPSFAAGLLRGCGRRPASGGEVCRPERRDVSRGRLQSGRPAHLYRPPTGVGQGRTGQPD